ncbi:MAG TPA: prephenate dehydratase [Spirochaetota bacterium]|nr:prephenate dehydratase [Spirochaetota bacterium]
MNKRIMELDKKIVELLAERCKIQIEELKKLPPGENLFSAARVKELASFLESLDAGPLSRDLVKKIFGDLLAFSVSAVKPTVVAYLGPEGTFTHSAMLEVFGVSAAGIPVKSIHDVFVEVETGRADYGVVPVENSTEGAVTYTLDELMETELKITAEKYLRVSYSLVSVSKDIKSVKKLYSHPQSFGQCKEWLRKNLPDAEMHNVSSTSLAAETASWDKFAAAVTSHASAEIYGLNVLATNIEDSRQNYTRFFVIGEHDNPPSGKDKTSIICAVRDKPGALYDLLRPFNETGINMTKIESRPDKKKMWEYNFFIDFIGHRDSTITRSAVEKMKEDLIFLKILGSYPAEK